MAAGLCEALEASKLFTNWICTDSAEDKFLILSALTKADHFSPRTKLGSF
jgi:hypothetical protein